MMQVNDDQKDFLTKCYTKGSLNSFLLKAQAEYSAYRKSYSLLVIDIDGFKTFNDKYGHMFGDDVLKYFSSSLRLNLDDQNCSIIRFGGDEFVVIFSGMDSKETFHLTGQLENNVKNRRFLFKGREYKVTFSGGIASCPHDGSDPEEMLEMADKAMYYSKKRGKGKITQFSSMGWESRKRSIIMVLLAAIVIGAIATAHYVFKIDLNFLRDRIISVQKNVSSPSAKIYLRSGHTVEGAIVREDDNGIVLKFKMDVGEGTVSLKRSDIIFVDRK